MQLHLSNFQLLALAHGGQLLSLYCLHMGGGGGGRMAGSCSACTACTWGGGGQAKKMIEA